MVLPNTSTKNSIDRLLPSVNAAAVVGFDEADAEKIVLLLKILGWHVEQFAEYPPAPHALLKLVFVRHGNNDLVAEAASRSRAASAALAIVGGTTVFREDPEQRRYHLPWPIELAEVEQVVTLAG